MKPGNTHVDRPAGAGTPRGGAHHAPEFVTNCVALTGSGQGPPSDLDPVLGLIPTGALATLRHASPRLGERNVA